MRGFWSGDGSSASSSRLKKRGDRYDEIGNHDCTYLGSLLRSAGLPLREGRRRGFTALFGRLSLRKEEHQRIVFTR